MADEKSPAGDGAKDAGAKTGESAAQQAPAATASTGQAGAGQAGAGQTGGAAATGAAGTATGAAGTATGAAGTATGAVAQAPLSILAQYVRDFSFESPKAPDGMLQAANKAPRVNVSVDTRPRQIKDRSYEVLLGLRCDAKLEGDETLFLAELQYAGIFVIGQQVQENLVQPLLFVEAPRMLFPFARAIIADSVRDGGFPSFLIQPIDFLALFRQRLQQAQQQQAKQTQQAAAAPAGAAQQGTSGNGGVGGQSGAA